MPPDELSVIALLYPPPNGNYSRNLSLLLLAELYLLVPSARAT